MFVLPGAVAAEAPLVYWSAEPVGPNQTALLQGARFGKDPKITISSLDGGSKVEVPVLDQNARSLRFVIPARFAPGVYACRLQTDVGEKELLLNAPQPWWFQADNGQRASQGGWLRVFGRCLRIGAGAPRLELLRDGKAFPLPVADGSPWQLSVALPADLAPAEYEIRVHNGTGGKKAWASAGKVVIEQPSAFWKSQAFSVSDFGATPDDAGDDSEAFRQALAAAEKNGGGIVAFGKGRYRLSGGFTLPPHVLLKGAGAALTHLSWADADAPVEAFLNSTLGEIGVEDLSLYACNYNAGLKVRQPESPGHPPHVETIPKNVVVRRVFVRFQPLTSERLHHDPAARKQRREKIESDGHKAVFDLTANNVQVTDCDVAVYEGIGLAANGDDIVCRNCRFHAYTAWCPIGGGRRVIVENNAFDGITVGTGNANVYFAHNAIAHQYPGFREGLTTDGPGCGPGLIQVTGLDGARLSYKTEGFRCRPAWVPADVRILEGTGVGQYRRVVTYDDTRIVMDRPFDIPPDQTSVVYFANSFERELFVENDGSDCGIAVQLFGGAIDCVVAGNRSARCGGFRDWGNNSTMYVEFLGNRITEGYGTEGPECNGGGLSCIHVIGPYIDSSGKVELFKGVTARGFAIRDNRLDNHSTITVRGNVDDVLIESNTLCDSPQGIVGDLWQGQHGVLLRGNVFKNVAVPLSPPDAAQRYRSVGQ